MPDVYADGMVRVSWVPAIANKAAPTTTELNAGLLLQQTMTPDGLMGFEANTADVDTSNLASVFDTTGVGRDSFSGTALRLKKQSGVDTIFNTLTKGTEGYIVIRRDLAQATAWASTQKCEVYPVTCGREKNLPPEKNTLRRYEVPVKISSEPELRATVA